MIPRVSGQPNRNTKNACDGDLTVSSNYHRYKVVVEGEGESLTDKWRTNFNLTNGPNTIFIIPFMLWDGDTSTEYKLRTNSRAATHSLHGNNTDCGVWGIRNSDRTEKILAISLCFFLSFPPFSFSSFLRALTTTTAATKTKTIYTSTNDKKEQRSYITVTDNYHNFFLFWERTVVEPTHTNKRQ